MKILDWFNSIKRSKVNNRLSDSSALTGSSVGDSERSKFVALWSDSKALGVLVPKRLKRL